MRRLCASENHSTPRRLRLNGAIEEMRHINNRHCRRRLASRTKILWPGMAHRSLSALGSIWRQPREAGVARIASLALIARESVSARISVFACRENDGLKVQARSSMLLAGAAMVCATAAIPDQ